MLDLVNPTNLAIQSTSPSGYNQAQRQLNIRQNREAASLTTLLDDIDGQSFIRFDRNIAKLQESIAYITWLAKKLTVLIYYKP